MFCVETILHHLYLRYFVFSLSAKDIKLDITNSMETMTDFGENRENENVFACVYIRGI